MRSTIIEGVALAITGSLTDKQDRFAQEYLVDLNATQAAIRAGYSPRTAHRSGNQNMQKRAVLDEIDRLKAKRAKRVEISADDTLARIATIAFADARSLSGHRIGSCRYCWGIGHDFQWKTEREFEAAVTEAEYAKKGAPPERNGGFGYRLNQSPNNECPECGGMGEPYAHFPDTDHLPPEAVALYRGTKVTRNGTEIVMADQDKQLELLARHLGLIKERDEGPVQDALADLLRAVQGKALPVASSQSLSTVDD